MNNTFNIYSEITPEIPKLYHYTSQVGLLGMVNLKKLWFTNIHYMNDSTEYTYSLQEIKAVINKFYDFGDNEFFIKLFPKFEEIVPIFSFSLSEEKDLLSQWRGYCPDGGFSISFFDPTNFKQIDQMIKINKLYIGKCLYEKDTVSSFIKEKILELTPEQFEIEKKEAINRNELKDWLTNLYTRVLYNTFKYAPLIKHPAFKEEKEWRIVANYADSSKISQAISYFEAVAVSSTSVLLTWNNSPIYNPFQILNDKLKFRQGKSFLVPYLEIPLSTSDSPLFVSDVIVGPNPNIELSIQACRHLLNDTVKVNSSELPYRNW